MMTIKRLETLPGGVRLEYQVLHSTPGRDGTTLSADLQLFVRSDKSWCQMKIEDCDGATPKDALDRMAVWLRRLAEGIETRKTTELPI